MIFQGSTLCVSFNFSRMLQPSSPSYSLGHQFYPFPYVTPTAPPPSLPFEKQCPLCKQSWVPFCGQLQPSGHNLYVGVIVSTLYTFYFPSRQKGKLYEKPLMKPYCSKNGWYSLKPLLSTPKHVNASILYSPWHLFLW